MLCKVEIPHIVLAVKVKDAIPMFLRSRHVYCNTKSYLLKWLMDLKKNISESLLHQKMIKT